jgi:hypothetical protein
MKGRTLAITGGALAAVAGVVIPLVTTSGPPAPPARVTLGATAGAPTPGTYASPGNCPLVWGAGGSVTGKLANWITTQAAAHPGNPIVFPHDACYVSNSNFELSGLSNVTIDGNGATLTQNVPGVNGGNTEQECGKGSLLDLVGNTNMTVNDLNLAGAADGINPALPAISTTATGTPTFGTIPLTSAAGIVPGNLVYSGAGGGMGRGPSVTSFYYVTSVNGGTNTITYKSPDGGTGTVSAGTTMFFDGNGGVHCLGYTFTEMQGNTNLHLSDINGTNAQGDGVSFQLPTDPALTSNAPNTGLVIASSDFNWSGYDCISGESIGPNGSSTLGATLTGNTFSNCQLNNIDFEVDEESSDFKVAHANQCFGACQTNVLFSNNTFSHFAGDLYVSLQGECGGVQQQNVTFNGNTIKLVAGGQAGTGKGIHIVGASIPACAAPVTKNAQAVHGDVIQLANTNNFQLGSLVTGTGLTGVWTVTDIFSPPMCMPRCTATITPATGSGAGGGAPAFPGTYTFTFGAPPRARNLNIGLTFTHNVVLNGVNSGFLPLNGGGHNCSPNCPSDFTFSLNNVNTVNISDNSFYIYSDPAYSPYQAVLQNNNVNNETLKGNNFGGAFSLFWTPNGGSTGIVNCGDTWGLNDTGPVKTSTATAGDTITFASSNNLALGQRVTGTGLTGTWVVTKNNTTTDTVTIAPGEHGGTGAPSGGSYSFFNDDGPC